MKSSLSVVDLYSLFRSERRAIGQRPIERHTRLGRPPLLGIVGHHIAIGCQQFASLATAAKRVDVGLHDVGIGRVEFESPGEMLAGRAEPRGRWRTPGPCRARRGPVSGPVAGRRCIVFRRPRSPPPGRRHRPIRGAPWRTPAVAPDRRPPAFAPRQRIRLRAATVPIRSAPPPSPATVPVPGETPPLPRHTSWNASAFRPDPIPPNRQMRRRHREFRPTISAFSRQLIKFTANTTGFSPISAPAFPAAAHSLRPGNSRYNTSGFTTMPAPEFMQQAISAAVKNVRHGGGPFGAVIVRDGEVIATGANHVTATNDPTVSCRSGGNSRGLYATRHLRPRGLRDLHQLRALSDVPGRDLLGAPGPHPTTPPAAPTRPTPDSTIGSSMTRSAGHTATGECRRKPWHTGTRWRRLSNGTARTIRFRISPTFAMTAPLASRVSRLGLKALSMCSLAPAPWRRRGRHIIHLEIGEPDFETPPHVVGSRTARAGRRLDALRTHPGRPGAAGRHRRPHGVDARHRHRPVGDLRDAGRQADSLLLDAGAARNRATK